MGALADAFLSIKIINIIEISEALVKDALASAIVLVPVSIGTAVNWGADAFAIDIVPVEVVWADLGAALAFAGGLVEDLGASASFSLANASAGVDVKNEARLANVSSKSWVALAFAVVGGEVLTQWASRVVLSWVLAEAVALLGVEVEAVAAFLGLAKAVASHGVEVVSGVFTLGVHAFAPA